MTRLPDGSPYRERRRLSITSKSAARRWGQDRERHLLQHGPPQAKKEVPTLEEFAPRFVDGHTRANRQKPSGIAATVSIVKWHLIPALGAKRLDAITNEQVQKLKLALAHRAPKTVNNVLTLLRTLLKKAVEWGELDRLPCTIKLLSNPKKTMGFHDFEEYERLLTVAQKRSPDAYLMVLLGGEAGLRLGEIVALEWGDVDLHARRLAVQRSDWCGHVTVPKGGRSRRLPMTQRLTSALKAARHLRSERVLCLPDGKPITRTAHQTIRSRSGCYHPRRRACATAHLLFAPRDESRAGSRDPGAGGPRGSLDDAALHALESGGNRRRDSVVGRPE
jgi:integrase